ncbi:hypothetical protein KFE25_013056 [Diacronema lutheri]|uniref:Uncharacterized protein n=1 Tax=Diacronema lutheri TaxID=2081491 RepID=A0A8J5XA68_DIALT|nr:hypothetical protein KFE25_013056 [Diacronema lutheri]
MGSAVMRDEALADGGAWRVRIHDGSRQLTWGEVLDRLRTDRAFALAFSRKLAAAPFGAFFWETPPLTQRTRNTAPFEFVCLPAEHLNGVVPDEAPFRAFVGGGARGTGAAVAFANLGGDSTLVAPSADADAARTGALAKYAHIAAFVRGASDAQAGAFWARVAEAVDTTVRARGDAPTWVSTEGSGVSWLHVRLDSRPKYFHWAGYKA